LEHDRRRSKAISLYLVERRADVLEKLTEKEKQDRNLKRRGLERHARLDFYKLSETEQFEFIDRVSHAPGKQSSPDQPQKIQEADCSVKETTPVRPQSVTPKATRSRTSGSLEVVASGRSGCLEVGASVISPPSCVFESQWSMTGRPLRDDHVRALPHLGNRGRKEKMAIARIKKQNRQDRAALEWCSLRLPNDEPAAAAQTPQEAGSHTALLPGIVGKARW
jgi:hypothetical protein